MGGLQGVVARLRGKHSGVWVDVAVDASGNVGTTNTAISDAIGTTADASSANTVIGRLKKLLSVLPAATGQATAAQSMPVVEATAATATVTSVADTASSTTILALNANRRAASIYNDSTATLYLKYGSTATTSDFTVKLFPDDYHEVFGHYTGKIDGIWSADASGSARVTELT